ncbi:hypothetical protein [Leuconostoc mesenteroides]|uniref:hypothetical protein n=1 Tax=Leuconostoc mesenteroides TaxID=1245 RepID=UPI000AF4452C|nr:hypothetical protein [Leuconostoc mesenteroides]
MANSVTAYYTFDKTKSDAWLDKVKPYFAKNVTLSSSTNTEDMKLLQAKLNGIFTVDSIKIDNFR